MAKQLFITAKRWGRTAWFMLSLLSVLVYTIGMFHHHHGCEVVVPLVQMHAVHCHAAESGTSLPASGTAHGICPSQQQLAMLRQTRLSFGLLSAHVHQTDAFVCFYALSLLLSLCVAVRRFVKDRGRGRPCLLFDTGRGWRAPPVC